MKTRYIILSLLLAAGFAAVASAADAPAKNAPPELVERTWSVRCEDEKTKKGCEVFQRLEVKANQSRVAEFAVGFADQTKKDTARGVVVLPLGILLDPGISMAIDDGKPVSFKSRYCSNAGCFSYITLDKDMLDAMKKGKVTKFHFKSMDNQDVNLEMHLENFDKALKQMG